MAESLDSLDVFDAIHNSLWKINVEYYRELILFQSHHINGINWFIHVVTIPMEWFGWLILISFFNLHLPVSILIALYYMTIQSKASNFTACLHVFLAMLVQVLIQTISSTSHLIIMSLGLQFSAWILQVFVGHWIFENNNPSMMKKLTMNSIILSILLVFDPKNILQKMKKYQ